MPARFERTGTYIFYSVQDKMQMAGDDAGHDLSVSMIASAGYVAWKYSVWLT